MPKKEYPIITGPSEEEVIQSLRSSEPFYEPGNPQGIKDYDTSYPAIFTTASENDPHTAQPIGVSPENIHKIGETLIVTGTAELIPHRPDEPTVELGKRALISYNPSTGRGTLETLPPEGDEEPEEY